MPWNTFDDKSTLVQVMAYFIEQQYITWAIVDPDPWCYMVSLVAPFTNMV